MHITQLGAITKQIAQFLSEILNENLKCCSISSIHIKDQFNGTQSFQIYQKILTRAPIISPQNALKRVSYGLTFLCQRGNWSSYGQVHHINMLYCVSSSIESYMNVSRRHNCLSFQTTTHAEYCERVTPTAAAMREHTVLYYCAIYRLVHNGAALRADASWHFKPNWLSSFIFNIHPHFEASSTEVNHSSRLIRSNRGFQNK